MTEHPFIYLDHAATTPLAPEVFQAMEPFLRHEFGNPNSLHAAGRAARRAVEAARAQVAALIGAQPREIVFTSGGSEADNLALKGTAWARRDRGRHLIVSGIEHHAVLDAARALERQGFELSVLPVDEHGRVDPADVRAALRQETVLVSVMLANNEVGTLQPLAAIGELLQDHPAWLHTDAVQAVGQLPVNVRKLGVDLLSLSAHKIYGPKGVGALYVREGLALEPLVHGGGQEDGRRSGTENVAGIVGLGAAAELTRERLDAVRSHLVPLRERLVRGVLEAIPGSRLTGHPHERLPGLASFCFEGATGETLVLKLDMEGICAATGSACTSGSAEPSHVLLALGLPRRLANGSLRLSLGRTTTVEHVDRVLQVLPRAVEEARRLGL